MKRKSEIKAEIKETEKLVRVCKIKKDQAKLYIAGGYIEALKWVLR